MTENELSNMKLIAHKAVNGKKKKWSTNKQRFQEYNKVIFNQKKMGDYNQSPKHE